MLALNRPLFVKDGINTATLYIYKRANTEPSDSVSGDSTYTFATGTLTLPATTNGWTLSIPETGGRHVWYRTATAASSKELDIIPDTEWSAVGTLSSDGIDGLPGEPGAPGTDGEDGLPAYIHFAYATSADGTTNFNTSYFEGASYFGTYTDFDGDDSELPSAYTWSKFLGEPGPKGDDGANGLNAYVHYAYATSADGETNFSLTYTGVESYIGWYSDFDLMIQNYPSAYEWSKFQGSCWSSR